MITYSNASHALTNALDYSTSLVTKDTRKYTFAIMTTSAVIHGEYR